MATSSIGAICSISTLWLSAILGAVLSFMLQVVLARELSPVHYGSLASALATITLMVPLCGFGTQALWLKVFGEEGWQARRWIPMSAKFMSFTSISVMIIIFLWARFGPHDETTSTLLILLLPIMLANLSTSLVSSMFQLEGRYAALSCWQIMPVFLKVLFLAFVWIFFSIDLAHVTITYLIVAVLTIFASFLILIKIAINGLDLVGHRTRRSCLPNKNFEFSSIDIKDYLRTVWPFGMAGIFYLIYYQSDIIFVRYLVGPEEAGIYNIAFVIMTAIYLLPSVIFQKFMMPKLHRWASHDKDKFLNSYRLGNGNMVFVGLAISISMWLLSPWIIPLIFGPSYRAAADVLMLLAFCVPIRFLAASVGAVLTTGEHMRRKVLYMGITAVFNICTNVFLIPLYAAIGAALTTVASEVLLLTLYLFAVKIHVFGPAAWQSWKIGFGKYE